jgi:hypothetical protein
MQTNGIKMERQTTITGKPGNKQTNTFITWDL